MKRISFFTLGLSFLFGLGGCAMAQFPVAPPAPQVQLRSWTELDEMLQSIALYPDPLIGQILSSSTLPEQVVMADRYVSGGGDPNQIDLQPWDPTVKALARYPTVLKWMDDNLSWTTALGQAFLYQPQDVMDSIQRLRAKAQALGNLQTTPQVNIYTSNGQIEILPADPRVIYVPVYQPSVVYYQRWSRGTPFISFGAGFSMGTWLNLDLDWRSHRVIEWARDHPRPVNYWTRRPAERVNIEISHATVWHPRTPVSVITRGGDRGWGDHAPRPGIAIRPEAARPSPWSQPPVVQRPRPTMPPRPPQGALIGVQGSRETEEFSHRGQQSRQKMGRPSAPVPSAPPARSVPPGRSRGDKEKR